MENHSANQIQIAFTQNNESISDVHFTDISSRMIFTKSRYVDLS